MKQRYDLRTFSLCSHSPPTTTVKATAKPDQTRFSFVTDFKINHRYFIILFCLLITLTFHHFYSCSYFPFQLLFVYLFLFYRDHFSGDQWRQKYSGERIFISYLTIMNNIHILIIMTKHFFRIFKIIFKKKKYFAVESINFSKKIYWIFIYAFFYLFIYLFNVFLIFYLFIYLFIDSVFNFLFTLILIYFFILRVL